MKEDGQEQQGEPSGEVAEGVKAESDEPSLKKSRNKPDSDELHMYTDDELSGYRRRDLMADAELLDGMYSIALYLAQVTYLMLAYREIEEREAKPERPQRLSEARRGVLAACSGSRRGHQPA